MGRLVCALLVVLLLASGCGKKPEASKTDEGRVAVPPETAAKAEEDEDAKPAAFPEKALAKLADALSEGTHITKEDIERYAAAYPEISRMLAEETLTQEKLDEAAKKHGYEGFHEYQNAMGRIGALFSSLKALVAFEEVMALDVSQSVIDNTEKQIKMVLDMASVSREDLDLAFEHWDVLKNVTIK